MKILFNTWAGAFFNPGGGEFQLLHTVSKLQESSCKVLFFDQWKPQRDVDVFHQFSIQPGVEFPMIEYRNLGIKVALSTILWAEYPKDSWDYHYLHRVLNLADVLFTNSDMESDKLSRAFDVDRAKFHKTVNGISQAYQNKNTSKDFRDRFGIEGDFILSVANIDTRKNTKLLAEACHRLNKQLVLVGHIRHPDYFDDIQKNVKGFVHVGPIDDVEMLKSAYQQTELFALPSLCETPSIAALEAASQGARIAITSEGSTREYFNNHVTYVNPLSVEDITSGIEAELSATRQSETLISLARSYTWDRAAREVLEGYQR